MDKYKLNKSIYKLQKMPDFLADRNMCNITQYASKKVIFHTYILKPMNMILVTFLVSTSKHRATNLSNKAIDHALNLLSFVMLISLRQGRATSILFLCFTNKLYTTKTKQQKS